MRNLFVITGPPGSGKTPVVRELLRLGHRGVDEPAREILAELRATGAVERPLRQKDRQLLGDLMLERAISDYERVKRTKVAVFFDRGIPDLVGYLETFDLETSNAWAAAQRYRYEDMVFVLPSWAEIYVTDEERTMSFEFAESFGDRVRNTYSELGYTLVDVPRDSIDSRALFIQETVTTRKRG